jgi:hypothetical protein
MTELSRGERIRNRLLGCLSHESIVTEDAQRLLAELSSANAIPPNRRPRGGFAGYSRSLNDDDYLSEQGVPMDEVQNREVANLIKPVQAFETAHLNGTPSAQAIEEAASGFRALRNRLDGARAGGVHSKLIRRGWAVLAEASERVFRAEGLQCSDPVVRLAKEILLEASRNPDPPPSEEHDSFEESPSWSGGTVRIEAAQGVMELARNQSCMDAVVQDTIDRLAADPVPAVRYQVSRYLNAIYETDRDRMWSLVEAFAREEQSRGVLQGLLNGPFDRLYWAAPERIADLAVEIYERIRVGAGSEKVRERCVQILAGAYSRLGHEGASKILNAIADEPESDKHSALVAISFYREALIYGPTDPSDPAKDAMRRRAFHFVSALLDNVVRKHDELLLTQPSRFSEWPEDARKLMSDIVEISAGIGTELYFGSGAYAASNESKGTPPAVRARFYDEAREIIGKLADVGEPSLAHHLLETVEFLIPVDPGGAFLLIARIVRGGRKGGYQYDSLAVDLLVRLVEKYLVDFKAVLRENAECRGALIETLDVFVDAGWPAARALAYRLDEMYRA